MRVENISHSDSNIELKVNFFADCFHYYNENIKEIEINLLETPLSLFENMLIQIEENKEYSKYIESYINNDLINDYQFETASELVDEFYSYVNKKSVPYSFNADEKETLSNLIRNIIELLQKDYFKEAVEELISFVTCKHDLDIHIKEIIYYTKIIVNDFLLNGFTKNDLKHIFTYIFSKEIDRFPFPENLFFNVDKEFHEKVKKDFLKDQTIKDQFEGIINFRFKPQKEAYVVFKIFGICMDETENEAFNDVEFFSIKSKKLEKLRNTDSLVFRNYFNVSKDEASLVSVKVLYRSETYAEEVAIKKINDVVQIINTSLNTSAYVDNDVIITTNFIDARCTHRPHKKTCINNLKNRRELQSFKVLSYHKFNSPALDYIKRIEYIYEEAKTLGRPNMYWRYLEVLHKEVFVNKIKIIENVPKILLLDFRKLFNEHTKYSV